MTQELKPKKIIAELIKKGADDVIIASYKVNHNQVKFYNNEICLVTSWDSEKLGLFAAIKKRIIQTEISNAAEIEKTLNKVLSLAKVLEPNREYESIAKGPFKYKKISGIYDKKVESVNVAETAADAIGTALSNGALRTAGVLETSSQKTELFSSNNVEAEENSTNLYFSMRSFTGKDASGHEVSCARNLNDFNYKKAAADAAITAKSAKKPVECTPGKYDVLFYPLPFANLVEHLGHASSIFSVESGLSCLSKKLGKPIASSMFSLFDDATIASGFGSSSCDAEGVPSKKNLIVDSGLLNTYLHNTSTAKRYKTKTTANAGLIAPEPRNLVVYPGKPSREKMVGQMNKGIIVTNLWYTRFQNYSTGDFSTIPRDGIFLVKNGRIISSIKNIRISENLLNIFKNIYVLGNNPKQVFGWEVGVPTALPDTLVKNINITAPKP